MSIKDIASHVYVGKGQLVAWGVLAISFVTMILLHTSAWGFVVVSLLFIGYMTWAGTRFLVGTHGISKGNFVAWLFPVGLAALKALACLGLAWLMVWIMRRVFNF